MKIQPIMLAVMLSLASIAHATDSDPVVSSDIRKAVVERLAEKLATDYVFPDKGKEAGAAVKAKLAQGAYAQDTKASVFAAHLAKDLRASGNDVHLDVIYKPDAGLPPDDDGKPAPKPSRSELDQEQATVDRLAGGIAAIRRLPGNVAYIDLRGFFPADFAANRYTLMMQSIAGADSLILDLRQNTGGDPHAVALLLSYFFAENDSRHLTDLHWRKDDKTDVYYTFPITGPRFLGPIRVLTSPRTVSAGEACAYDLQVQKRATVIGTKTTGGANPAAYVAIGHDFIASIAIGNAINPVTHTNWEHVGVTPDTPTTPEKALDVAYRELLENGLKTATDPDDKAWIEKSLAKLHQGNWDVPNFAPLFDP